MPFVLIVAGLVLLITAVNGTVGQLGVLLKQDVFGPQGFMFWIIAIIVVGALGYIKQIKPLSDGFLVLVLLVLFLNNRGVFQQFMSATTAISQGASTPTNSALPPLPPLSQSLGITAP